MTDPVAAGAEAAFASYLARIKNGEEVDFEAFCAERPGVAGALRDLHAAWKSGGSKVRSIADFLEHSANVSLDEEAPKDDQGSGVRDRLENLAARTGRYALRGEVARGGMGVILKVWDQDLRRTLAMKAAFGNVSDVQDSDAAPRNVEHVSRFLEEAQINGQLDHPGIVPVHELGVDDEGRLFFTMRLVRGKTLDETFRLARGEKDGWNRVRALTVITRVCEAMAYAHSKGVLHRDIKPANIMVGKFGEVYVMDWGLAKVIGRPDLHNAELNPKMSVMRTQVLTDRIEEIQKTPDSATGTLEGTIIGTPAYMPPEQAEGRIDDLDPRSDIYSVGALLYTLLTGRMPYVDPKNPLNGGQVLMALIGGPPTPVHEIASDVPPELIAVCEKAMARAPSDRYATMDEFAEDLRAFIERRVVRAYQTGALAEFRKWVERNKGIAAAVAALVLLSVFGSFYVAWQQRQRVREVRAAQATAVQARGVAEKNARQANANAERARENLERAERQGYLANLAAAHASLRMHDTREARRLLEACPDGLRGWEWRHLWLATDTSRATLRAHAGKVSTVAFGSDGRILSGGADKTVRLWDAESGQAVLSLAGPAAPVTAVAYSRDGAYVAAATNDAIVYVWESEGRLRGALPGRESVVRGVAFSPDGSRLATCDDEGVRIWDARTLQELFAFGDESVGAVAFAPDGARLATGSENGVAVWHLAQRKQIRFFEIEEGATCLAFGDRIIAGSLDADIHVFDPGGREAPVRLSGHADPVTAVALAPNGLLASASYDKTVRVWDIADGIQLAVLQGHDEAVLAVACDAEQRVVSASADGTLRLWRLVGGDAVLTLRGDEDFLAAVAFDPTGASVAAASAGHGEVRVWDLQSGREVRYLEERGGGLSSFVFAADGKYVVTGGEEDAIARILDAASGDEVKALAGHDASVACVALSPDRARIATGSADHTARLWDFTTGKEVRRLEGHTERVTTVAFSPDGERLLTASLDGTARVWDANTGKHLRTLQGHGGPVLVAIFDPSGARIVTGCGDARIRVYAADSDEPAQVLAGHAAAVSALAFDRGGSRLASGGRDKTVRVWDGATGEPLLRLGAHDGWVTGVAFSPDGASIASCSYDTTAKVWRTRLR